ncbi:hypothetical protein DENIS_4738 [Desulfonema ishimotonii]|uniref:Uncharacterized protein n=1 Tax=Desulfonema ishimotonii TaxID=45657 RepID=A0A401G3C9_9BACT|nr:hypothetical protein [Desulfonema ishimotonii]GBC63740.1 hypothetical protein DENIS_4738 [Desulfonema ishimotonii]
MEAERLGELWNFLICHRGLRNKVPPGQSLRAGEGSLAHYYHFDATEAEKAFFMRFIKSQGFMLRYFDADMIPGIPVGGFQYVMLRDPRPEDNEIPAWIDPVAVLNQLKIRGQELSKGQLQVWFFVLWQNFLGLIYTNMRREATHVSEYVRATFTRAQLVESVTRFIQELREEADIPENSPVRVLFESRTGDVITRVNAFIRILEQVNHIRENRDKSYTQTLLSAKALEESYQQDLKHLIPHPELSHSMFSDLYPNYPASEAGTDEAAGGDSVSET